MTERWIEGRFEGTYSGERRAGDPMRGDPRRFSFRLQSGEVRDASPVDGPFPEADDDTEPSEIRQDRVGRIRLSVPSLDVDRSDTSLFDVRIVDWRLSRPAESKGRSHGRIEGTIRARLTPAQPEPAEPLPEAAARPPSPLAPEAPERARTKRRAHAHTSGRATVVDALDADTLYDRLRWLCALVVVLGVAAGLWRSCGGRLAGIWLAVMLGAMCLRRVARSAIHAGAPSQALFAGALVTAQALLWLEPMVRGVPLGCVAPTPAQLAGLGGAVAAASLLRGRAALAGTSLVWTVCVFSWCAALGGACTAPAVTPPAATEGAPPAEHRPAPRTSPDGHWPVMPGRWQGGGAAGIELGGGGGGGNLGDATGGPSAAMSSIGGGAGSVEHADLAGGGGAPEELTTDGSAFDDGAPAGSNTPELRPESSGDRAPQLSQPPSSSTPAPAHRRRGTASTRGGWVAADHRRVSAGGELISLEHANRVPAAFFASGGQRRVYVPTDPIFEPGGADVRATGALQLGRIAALLGLHPERRSVLVVHTDVGGELDTQQRLSERRASSVRAWLIDRGHVAPDRFEVVGVGGTHPLVPPDGSYAAQQPNRRIEIGLIE